MAKQFFKLTFDNLKRSLGLGLGFMVGPHANSPKSLITQMQFWLRMYLQSNQQKNLKKALYIDIVYIYRPKNSLKKKKWGFIYEGEKIMGWSIMMFWILWGNKFCKLFQLKK
jgi:hypothetical protein